MAYGRIEVCDDGLCEVDLFVQDAECCRIADPDLLEELTRRVRTAVALPVRIDIKDAFDATCTELTVTAAIDSGGRGRPRVTFDVTQGLSVAGVSVFMADGEAVAGRRGGQGAGPLALGTAGGCRGEGDLVGFVAVCSCPSPDLAVHTCHCPRAPCTCSVH